MIKDGEGNLVREIVQENIPGGDHSFVWDGLDRYNKQVQEGIYKIDVVAEGERGKALDVKLSKVGKVTGVSFEGNEPILLVEGRKVPFKEIVRVEANGPQAGGLNQAAQMNPAAQLQQAMQQQGVAAGPKAGEAMDGGPVKNQRPRM
jgi:hypothetical protein